MPEFNYSDLLPIGPDKTKYRLVTTEGVSTFTASGNTFTIGTADGGTFSASIQPDSVRLGTDTTGAYVGNLVAGTGITITGLGNEGTTPTITNAGVTSWNFGYIYFSC
jgi:hypothetical protein